MFERSRFDQYVAVRNELDNNLKRQLRDVEHLQVLKIGLALDGVNTSIELQKINLIPYRSFYFISCNHEEQKQ